MPVEVGTTGLKGIRFRLDAWYQNGEIHLTTLDDKKFRTSVNNKEGSKRCHRNLYMHLKKLMEKHGGWPEGIE